MHRRNCEYIWACRDFKNWMNSWRKRLPGCLEDATVGSVSSVALRDLCCKVMERKPWLIPGGRGFRGSNLGSCHN